MSTLSHLFHRKPLKTLYVGCRKGKAPSSLTSFSFFRSSQVQVGCSLLLNKCCAFRALLEFLDFVEQMIKQMSLAQDL